MCLFFLQKPKFLPIYTRFRHLPFAICQGFKGMWRGWVPSCQRAGLVQLGDLTTYDYAKQKLKNQGGIEEGPVLHAMSSAVAGLVAAGMGTPADVIKTRVMNQPVDAAGKGLLYSGA